VTERQQMMLGILKVLKVFSFIIFIIGIILNFDGYEILKRKNEYKDGSLNVDSIRTTPSGTGGLSTFRALGYADSVYTEIILGNENAIKLKILLNEYYETKRLSIPIWYKPDGKLTLDRYPDETTFPTERIWKKALEYFLYFNCPFIAICIIDWRLKRKYRKLKNQKP
jgi:hypothetical protein